MNKKLTFNELVYEIAEMTSEPPELIKQLLIETAGIVKEYLKNDKSVTLGGLGRFRLKWNEERTRRNPQTGEQILVPGHHSVLFRPELQFRNFINKKYAHLSARPAEDNLKSDVAPSLIDTEKVSENSLPAEEKAEQRSGKNVWVFPVFIMILVVAVLLFYPFGDDEKSGDSFAAENSANPVTAVEKKMETKTDNLNPAKAVAEKTVETEKEEVLKEPDTEVSSSPFLTPGGTHTVAPGDKLWNIAGNFYNSRKLWPHIYGVNSEIIGNPDFLKPNTKLIIPPLEGTTDKLTNNDIINIADGYAQTYLAYKSAGKSHAANYLWVAMKIAPDHIKNKYDNLIDAADLEYIRSKKGNPDIR